ncbi:hypothetical protein H6768_04825 [Candidatus Peribacteria bacterium]|nr:hypothetical protein [Candidatus Peribacteria bacterium]
MKKRTLIMVAGSFLLLIILRNIFAGRDTQIVEDSPKVPKTVQTQMVGWGDFSEQVHVTGRVAPLQETVISTQ